MSSTRRTVDNIITLRTLNYGNYGISLSMGNAGFISSTEVRQMLSRNMSRYAVCKAKLPRRWGIGCWGLGLWESGIR